MRKWLVAAIVAIALPVTANAANGPLEFGPLHFMGGGLQQPVEQQSPNFFYICHNEKSAPYPCDPSLWVTNPTTCDWDVDDSSDQTGQGDLVPGGSAATDRCVISDGFIHYTGDKHQITAWVIAKSPNLVVTLTSDYGTFKTAVPVQREDRWYNYIICHVDKTPGPYPIIPDSNGGIGVPATYTMSVMNPTNRTIRDVWASMLTGFWGAWGRPCGFMF